MSSVTLELEDEFATLLRDGNQTAERAARELIVLELYRRAAISSGKAAELLGMPRWGFVYHASRLGIPYFDMTEDEWAAERLRSRAL